MSTKDKAAEAEARPLEDVLAEAIAKKDEPKAGKYDHDRRVQGVKEFAVAHYDEGGWDVVVETMDDEAIYQVVKRACSEKGAVQKMAVHVGAYAEYRAEIVATAGEPEPAAPDYTALIGKTVEVTYNITYTNGRSDQPTVKGKLLKVHGPDHLELRAKPIKGLSNNVTHMVSNIVSVKKVGR